MTLRGYKRIYLGVGTSILTLVSLLVILQNAGLQIIDLTGDIECLGSIDDPCISYFNVKNPTSKSVYIYNREEIPLDFNPQIKSYQLYVKYYGKWKPMNFTMATRLGNVPESRLYTFVFPRYSTKEFKLEGYKQNPTDKVKWGVEHSLAELDPIWDAPYNLTKIGDRIKKFNDNHTIDCELETTGYSPVDEKFHIYCTFKSAKNINIDVGMISPNKFNSGSKFLSGWQHDDIYKINHTFTCEGDKYGWTVPNELLYCNTTNINLSTAKHTVEVTSENYIDTLTKTIYWNTTHLNSYYEKNDYTSAFNYLNRTTILGNNIYYANFNMKKDKEYDVEFVIDVDKKDIPLKYSLIFGDISEGKIYFVLDPTIINSRTWTGQLDFLNNTVIANLSTTLDDLRLSTQPLATEDLFDRADNQNLTAGLTNGFIWWEIPPNNAYTYTLQTWFSIRNNQFLETGTGTYTWAAAPLSTIGAKEWSTGRLNITIIGLNFTSRGGNNRYGFGATVGFTLWNVSTTANNRWVTTAADNATAAHKNAQYAIRLNPQWNFQTQMYWLCHKASAAYSTPTIPNAGVWLNKKHNYTIDLDLDNNVVYFYIDQVYSGSQSSCDLPVINSWSAQTIDNDCGGCTQQINIDSITFDDGVDVLSTSGVFSDRQSWSPQTGGQFTNISIELTGTASDANNFKYNCTTNASLDTSDWIAFSTSGTNVIQLPACGPNEDIFFQIQEQNDGTTTQQITSFTLYEAVVGSGDTCDTCTIDCTENCIIDSLVDCSATTLRLSGAGLVRAIVNVTADDFFKADACTLFIDSSVGGSLFIT